MARRKAPKAPTTSKQTEGGLVLVGDIRQAPFELQEGGRTFRPVVALWARADDGQIVGQWVDEPGHPAESLVQALRAPGPIPGLLAPTAMPSRIVLFDEELARQVKSLLAPLKVEVMIAAPFKPFDDLFKELFANVQPVEPGWLPPDLPENVARSLVSAAERLWRAKPWTYVLDEPPFAIVPDPANGRFLLASVLGAREEVFGAALYTSAEDYETTLMLGESPLFPPPFAESPAAIEAAATQLVEAMRHPVFLVSFDPKDEVGQIYRDQLAHWGWSRRLGTVPTFAALGGGREPGPLTAPDASAIAIALDALVTFCQSHRQQLTELAFPIRDAVEVGAAGKAIRVGVSIPGEDPSATPATVYRFKVSLAHDKDVWRTIDVRSDQTLQDLHGAIQEAFGWDDDHMYAFFLSGKAWDTSTEYSGSGPLGPSNNSGRARLDRLNLRTRKRFLYIFDFGDEWRHEIRVEKAGLPPDGGEYPRIVEEQGKAPPQYGDAEVDD